MNTYVFVLEQIGSVKISAPTRFVAMQLFEEYGFAPSMIKEIKVFGGNNDRR